MNYFITYTGKLIYIDRLSPDAICLEDIAHHLTNIQRYNGAAAFNKSYSVAQHCINVAEYIYMTTHNLQLARFALLHDAAEAYLGDLISSVKHGLNDYISLEARVESCIYDKYNISFTSDELRTVKMIDKNILLDEALAVFPEHYQVFQDQYPDLTPLGIAINTQHSKIEVFQKFMSLCKKFRITDNQHQELTYL